MSQWVIYGVCCAHSTGSGVSHFWSRFRSLFMFSATFWSPLCLQGNWVGTSDPSSSTSSSSSRLSSPSLPPSFCLCLLLHPPPPPRPSCEPSQPGVNQGAGWWRWWWWWWEGWMTERQTVTLTHKQNSPDGDMMSGSRQDALRSGPARPACARWPQHKHVRQSHRLLERHLHKAASVAAWLTLTWGSMWDGRSLLLPPLLLFPTSLSPAPCGWHRETSRPTPSAQHGCSWCSLISQPAEDERFTDLASPSLHP